MAAVVGPSDLAGLQEGFGGELLLPGHDGYKDARRVWNGSIDSSPALIARCAGVSEVIKAVNFARDNGLLLAVRGRGTASPASRR